MTFLSFLKSFFSPLPPLFDQHYLDQVRELQHSIIEFIADGDGICEEALIALVQQNNPFAHYLPETISLYLAQLVRSGRILTDGSAFVCPLARPNTAAKVQAGGRII